jgi:hypothetical protein
MASTSNSAPPILSRRAHEEEEGRDSEDDRKRLKMDSGAQVSSQEGTADRTRNTDKSGSRRDAAGWKKSRKGKEKGWKNIGRNSRRGTRPEGGVEAAGDGDKTPRFPKRQCALLIGFCGTGCNGMQMYVCNSSVLHVLKFRQ